MAKYRFTRTGEDAWEVSCTQGVRGGQQVVRMYEDVPSENIFEAAYELAEAAKAERERPTWIQRPLQELIVEKGGGAS